MLGSSARNSDVNSFSLAQPGNFFYSQVIKGLVFKKNTAHKHMPTKLRNPRLLLLKGSVGHSAGLSSLNSVEKVGRRGTIFLIISTGIGYYYKYLYLVL